MAANQSTDEKAANTRNVMARVKTKAGQVWKPGKSQPRGNGAGATASSGGRWLNSLKSWCD
jgi:hypothetical protein